MEKSFTFRFYNVSRDNAAKPPMVDVLRAAAKEKDRQKREQKLAEDLTIRLEELQNDGPDAVIGEFLRCQDTNLPSELDGAQRKSLTAKKLAHSVVFRLNHKLGVIGIQHDPRIVSLGRILEYLHTYDARAFYEVAPRLDPKAWQKFKKGSVRKLSLRIASPDSMNDLGGGDSAASTGIRTIAKAYDAPSIGIELSMGHRKGFLSEAVTDFADKLTKALGPTARLDKLTAVTVVNDTSEELDLIEERQVLRDTLAIDDRDPIKNYKVKIGYLSKEMKRIIG
ncbi:hypothetical protein HFO15_11250 [Rhizobium laguerreae]|uniref:hypothetical protein n=1 Tax=Rhizobium laguerreae TaxID=1076926 RepID=UPI00144221FF|nr:hypothetical protein [Rhizobium laguerreae]MBY3262225.1 hypothetical protein [Rhizobium laguerreae]NKM16987.1 hypothetical protein [Rhizobium laguerreae]